ncbi:hypothetical protein OQZ29_08890 [Pedobacter agri]|uniref:Uncharacterized protein n=2 Tax=Pedobacter agri TaxID=454586 RepID=A0A9X3DFF4_9SPHI|nr:hypothetical protein [Pedobacter agri]MCX3264858.1 hypothetical protein [Pedobacter agri]
MPKEIKAIQCPKCGSTQKEELRQGYFRCQDCDTEYFLDDDDININHNISYSSAIKPATTAPQKIIMIIVALVIFIVLAGILLPLPFNSKRVESNLIQIPVLVDSNAYRWGDREVIAFENRAGALIIAIMGYREYEFDENNQKTGNYIAFYDAITGKELSKQRLMKLPQERLNNAAFRRFENGDIYAIGNKSLLYKIDQINTRLSDVPADFFSRHKELAAGIAQLEFIGSEWGDGLKLVTNDGKRRIFFPITDKVFTEKSSYTAEKALAIKEPGAKTRTYFLFSELSDDFPDEPIKLMMYTQKDNKGGPNTRPFFQKKDYTFFYGKKVISDFRQGADYVISYKDLTPGRSYYSPEILYYDNHYVLIMFKATAGASSNTIIQCLSVPDGKIMFSMPVDRKRSIAHTAYHYKNGFVLETYEAMYITDMKGKIIKEFKIIN